MEARRKSDESGRFALLVVGVVTAIGVWALVLVMIGRDGSEGDRTGADRAQRATTTEVTRETSDAADGVEILDPGPLRARGNVAVVATDREVVVWGTDGAAYDPKSATWRMLSPSPLATGSEPPLGVWTGDEVVIVWGRGAAAWDPDANAWRALPEAPVGPVRAAEWTGDEIVVWPGPAALDPITGTWRDLPRPPIDIEDGRNVVLRWTDDELLLLGQAVPRTQGVVFGGAAGAAYDPVTDSWRELPTPTGLKAEALAGDWNGRELVLVNYDLSARAYDPKADEWRDLPPVPARFYEWYPLVGSVEDDTAVFMAQSIVIRDSSGRWTPVPYGGTPSAVPVSAAIPNVAARLVTLEDRLYVFGFAYDTEKNAFAAIDLVARARSAETIQVGLFSLTLPRGAHLEGARFERSEVVEGLPPAETVTVEVSGAAGDCSVASTYIGTFGDLAIELRAHAERIPISVTPADGSDPWRGLAGLDPDRELIRLDDSDLLEVSCRKKGQARELARFVSAPRS